MYWRNEGAVVERTTPPCHLLRKQRSCMRKSKSKDVSGNPENQQLVLRTSTAFQPKIKDVQYSLRLGRLTKWETVSSLTRHSRTKNMRKKPVCRAPYTTGVVHCIYTARQLRRWPPTPGGHTVNCSCSRHPCIRSVVTIECIEQKMIVAPSLAVYAPDAYTSTSLIDGFHGSLRRVGLGTRCYRPDRQQLLQLLLPAHVVGSRLLYIVPRTAERVAGGAQDSVQLLSSLLR